MSKISKNFILAQSKFSDLRKFAKIAKCNHEIYSDILFCIDPIIVWRRLIFIFNLAVLKLKISSNQSNSTKVNRTFKNVNVRRYFHRILTPPSSTKQCSSGIYSSWVKYFFDSSFLKHLHIKKAHFATKFTCLAWTIIFKWKRCRSFSQYAMVE